MNLVAVIFSLLVGLFILVGSLIGISFKSNKKLTDLSISLAFGVIVGLIILELIPETFEILNGEIGTIRSVFIIILSLIGIVILKILDLFIPHHEHEVHEHSKNINKSHLEHLAHIGIISSIALFIHNVIEGMSLYLITSSNITSGFLLFIGIGLHNIPLGLVISSTLTTSKYPKLKILRLSLLVSLSTFIGGICMMFMGGVDKLLEGILLGLTIGMLIYISIFELLHQIYHMKNKKLALTGVGIGVVILILSVICGNTVH